MPLTSVPGQVSAGYIDGYLRDDPADGTLGLPDLSLVPYTYAPLLGSPEAAPQWTVDQFRANGFAGFKGAPDGYGALRNVGAARGAVKIAVVPQATGVRNTSPDGSRAPEYTWGPRDFAFAVRHSGAEAWSAAGPPLTYVALTQETNSVGIRQTTSQALGPWDAEKADSAAVVLPANVKVWDGNAHSVALSAFGQNVFCLIDDSFGVPFRAPRAYRRKPDGSTDTAVFSNMSATGSFMGFDCRGPENYLYAWEAMQPASGDFFYYDMGPTTVQAPPGTSSALTTTASGETWTVSGTVNATKDGAVLAANASAYFSVDQPYGVLCTRWGPAASEGGLVLRRVDANNYYMVTSTGVWHCINGALARFHTFTTPLTSGSHVAVRNWPGQVRVYVDGKSVAWYFTDFHKTGKGVGFVSPASGSSTFRYIAFQPLVSDPVLPTS